MRTHTKKSMADGSNSVGRTSSATHTETTVQIGNVDADMDSQQVSPFPCLGISQIHVVNGDRNL